MALKELVYKGSLVLVPPLYTFLSRLIFSTCQVREFGRENLDGCREKGPFIACVWHYSVLYALSVLKGKKWVAMVSASASPATDSFR